MTTIDAAAARRGHRSVVFAAFAAFVGFGLGGCETGSNLFATTADPNASIIAGQAPAGASQAAKIAIAPVIGAPDTVAKQLQTQLTSAIEAQRITVAKGASETAEFTLRGYVVSAREKGRTKVSYIWDVTDSTGRRVNRITGEEVLSGTQSSDPWAAVTPQVVDTISSKTAGSLMSWLPSQSAAAPVAMGTTTPASTSQQPIPTVAGSVQTAASPPPASLAAPTGATSAAAGPTTVPPETPEQETARALTLIVTFLLCVLCVSVVKTRSPSIMRWNAKSCYDRSRSL